MSNTNELKDALIYINERFTELNDIVFQHDKTIILCFGGILALLIIHFNIQIDNMSNKLKVLEKALLDANTNSTSTSGGESAASAQSIPSVQTVPTSQLVEIVVINNVADEGNVYDTLNFVEPSVITTTERAKLHRELLESVKLLKDTEL